MERYEGIERSFTQLSRAWYGYNVLNLKADKPCPRVDEIRLGVTGLADFGIVWMRLSLNEVGVRLEVFDDAWPALRYFHDLLGMMENMNETPNPEGIRILCEHLNIKDVTKTERGSDHVD